MLLEIAIIAIVVLVFLWLSPRQLILKKETVQIIKKLKKDNEDYDATIRRLIGG